MENGFLFKKVVISNIFMICFFEVTVYFWWLCGLCLRYLGLWFCCLSDISIADYPPTQGHHIFPIVCLGLVCISGFVG